MKHIFWTFADASIKDYIITNTSIQDLSIYHDIYFLCTDDESVDLVKQYYHNPHIIISENNAQVKGNKLFDAVRDIEYDTLVKIDLDAVLYDLPLLITLIESNIKPMSVIGNYRQVKQIRYIRGGCQATHKTLADKIKIKKLKNDLFDYDFPFAEAALEVGAELINRPLFEIDWQYSGHLPVWHPPKSKKYQHFTSHINNYNNIKAENDE